MERRSLVLGAAGIAFTAAAQAQITDLNNAINKAGRHRALSQRLSKTYALLGLGVETKDARRALTETIDTFDRSLAELRSFAPTKPILDTYATLDGHWQNTKALVHAQTPSKDGLAKLLSLDAMLLQTAQQGTVLLQQTSGNPGAVLVNVAGRQRMLSQRIAKYFFAARWGVAEREARAEADKARKEFLAALTLLKSRAGTRQQQSSLQAAEGQWTFFQTAMNLASSSDNHQVQSKLARASELILLAFDDVTGAFEKA